ncbi:MAG: molybdenum cofactor biosynthesis protein MoaE, partial [SAR324 cluster bacterium]|nr:molybdenum cofactor biosynthesis protein MoaE [SAR324 cluster bacterium]
MTSQVTRETIDLNRLLARAKNNAAGAVLLFSGDVRNHSEGRAVDFLEYETHESMAQKQIAEIVVEAKNRWDLHYVEVIHRFANEDGEYSFLAEHPLKALQRIKILFKAVRKVVIKR